MMVDDSWKYTKMNEWMERWVERTITYCTWMDGCRFLMDVVSLDLGDCKENKLLTFSGCVWFVMDGWMDQNRDCVAAALCPVSIKQSSAGLLADDFSFRAKHFLSIC